MLEATIEPVHPVVIKIVSLFYRVKLRVNVRSADFRVFNLDKVILCDVELGGKLIQPLFADQIIVWLSQVIDTLRLLDADQLNLLAVFYLVLLAINFSAF